MQKCPHCRHSKIVKKGVGRLGDQRYLCRNCGRTFGTENQRSHDEPTRRLALHLRVEGMLYQDIQRLLGICRMSVVKWVRHLNEMEGRAKPAGQVEVIAGDELRARVEQGKIPLKSGGLLIVASCGSLAGKWAVIVPPAQQPCGPSAEARRSARHRD